MTGPVSRPPGSVPIVLPPLETFRDRLDWARRAILPPGRVVAFSATEMAEMIGRKVAFDSAPVAEQYAANYSLSKTYLSDMLSGHKTNPTLDVIRTLGAFFRTGSAFFAADDADLVQRIAAQVAYVRSARDTKQRVLNSRANRPSPEALAQLGGQVMQWLLDNVDGLPIGGRPDVEDDDAAPPV